MKTFHITYKMDGLPKVHQADIDAPSKEKAIKTLRANTRVTDIVKVEDVTGPSELKELLRF
jgi:hypothetical protein